MLRIHLERGAIERRCHRQASARSVADSAQVRGDRFERPYQPGHRGRALVPAPSVAAAAVVRMCAWDEHHPAAGEDHASEILAILIAHRFRCPRPRRDEHAPGREPCVQGHHPAALVRNDEPLGGSKVTPHGLGPEPLADGGQLVEARPLAGRDAPRRFTEKAIQSAARPCRVRSGHRHRDTGRSPQCNARTRHYERRRRPPVAARSL